MAGQRPLKPLILVRIQARQLIEFAQEQSDWRQTHHLAALLLRTFVQILIWLQNSSSRGFSRGITFFPNSRATCLLIRYPASSMLDAQFCSHPAAAGLGKIGAYDLHRLHPQMQRQLTVCRVHEKYRRAYKRAQ